MDKQGENEKLDKKALKRQALDAYRLKNTLRPCNIDLLFKIPQENK